MVERGGVKRGESSPEKERDKKEFGVKLQRAMTLRGMIDQDLLDRLGMPRNQNKLTRWRDGKGYPTPNELGCLSEILQIPVVYWCDRRLQNPADALNWSGGEQRTADEITLARMIALLGTKVVLARILGAPETPDTLLRTRAYDLQGAVPGLSLTRAPLPKRRPGRPRKAANDL